MAQKELFDRQVTKRGGGQVSRGDQDQPAEIEQTRLKIFREVAATEEAIRSSRYQNINDKPKIQRVPVMFRDHTNFRGYFEPRVIAIGPINHGKARYEWGEELKLRLAVNFVRDSEQNEARLLKKVDEYIKELRECYDKEAIKNYDNDSLALMLFVDGCSTLEFIYKYDDLESFQIKKDQVVFAERDMFLLENQLPYQLLKLLMSSSNIHEALKDSIERFVQMHGVAPGATKQHPQHETIPMEQEPTHLLEYLLTTMLGYPPKRKSETRENAQSICNVQELQAAGIHFRQRTGPSVLSDIYFKSYICCGFLYLPKIKVDDSMRLKFMNLIAYEMCPDFQNDFGVASYISFLNSLIDHPDDVKHLRKKHILRNLLGSDEEVVQLFNEMDTIVVPNNQFSDKVKSMIEAHCNTTWKIWIAQFFHDHFSKPWVLGSIGVLSGLGMIAVQTWYTVNSDNPSSPCKAFLEYLKARGY
ncbi:hypothetical protein CerSpe_241990 [Prunus speciosa]